MAMTKKNVKQPAEKPVEKKPGAPVFLFRKENYRIMFIGLAIIALGYLLMVGGKSPDPNQFDPNEVYSWRRITLAPIVIILGLLVEIYAIMKKPAGE